MIKQYQPSQGDIVKVNFNPTVGHEQQGYRPALIVSSSIMSETSPFVWLVPISHGKYYHPLHVKLDSRTITNGTIFVEQLRSIDFCERRLIFVEKAPVDILKDVLNNIQETVNLRIEKR